MSEMQDLYQEIILDHNKRPRNFRALPEATHQAHGHNPLCGDDLSVHLVLKEDRIADITFQGEGCAISKASASLMTEALKGRTVVEARQEHALALSMLTDREEREFDLSEVGELACLAGVRRFPARVKCATLAWHAFAAAIDGQKEASTE